MPAETHVERSPIGPDDVFRIIRERLAEILEIDEDRITMDSDFAADLDADSLALIELVEALEEELGERTVGFSIDDEDLGDLKTVRDGKADAMTSAGNTGAAMAAALLRMGRIKGVARPAIAVPIPVPGRVPQILVDGGAAVDCTAEWLRQFAVMGREYARIHLGIDEPRVGLLSNGEEPGKGDDLRKAVSPMLTSLPGFIGNVEGSDFMQDTVDVIVTDGFTGNVALKTVEGAIRGTARLVFDTLMSTPELRQAAEIVMPALLEQADTLNPDSEGGCVLLGVDGICVIAHGSSNARAMRNSIRRAKECVEAHVADRMKGVIADAG
jgi:glycerol-3-phosphate acyltransferase PlsX